MGEKIIGKILLTIKGGVGRLEQKRKEMRRGEEWRGDKIRNQKKKSADMKANQT